MPHPGIPRTVVDVAALKAWRPLNPSNQLVFVESLAKWAKPVSGGVADEAASWASTHAQGSGYRWVLVEPAQPIGTAIDVTADTAAVRAKVISIETALRALGFAVN